MMNIYKIILRDSNGYMNICIKANKWVKEKPDGNMNDRYNFYMTVDSFDYLVAFVDAEVVMGIMIIENG